MKLKINGFKKAFNMYNNEWKRKKERNISYNLL